jgi:hypothetical protein
MVTIAEKEPLTYQGSSGDGHVHGRASAGKFPRLAATTLPDQALPMTSKSSTECRWTPAADAACMSPRTYPTNPSAAV